MKPDWLKVKFTVNNDFRDLQKIIKDHHLHTVCQSARCPNQSDCWQRRTATLMILGDTCTRNCRFCAVKSGKPQPVDLNEPQKIGRAVKLMGLKYAVITSVTRDDLPDGGAAVWAETIREIRRQNPNTNIEVLIPDFRGDINALETVLSATPDVLGHNLETVRVLYPIARPQADYEQSLRVIYESKKRGAVTKTGIMVGLGETAEQVSELMQDVLNAGCDILTLGQYLQPTKDHLPVVRYITPEEFKTYQDTGLSLGFRAVFSGPLVRSSFHAAEIAGFKE
ncbi:MAG: lipoyl synthase [Candidatus Marinimicrobia bacterium]|nr:lipoyl synthase [Candidatus Neomarinimicrobiota bacterium]MDD5539375.1 lipoyl synthase [Candidatus Neomarinimicrobiota bacterium]